MIGFIAVAAVIRGFVLSTLWQWFVIPTFGLAPLSIPVAIGIGLILSFTTHQSMDESSKNKSEKLFDAIVNPLIVLLIGWIITLFM